MLQISNYVIWIWLIEKNVVWDLKRVRILMKRSRFMTWFLSSIFLVFGINFFLSELITQELRISRQSIDYYLKGLLVFPILEEWAFRKIAIEKLDKKYGYISILLITSFGFAISHWHSNTGLLFPFIAGIFLAVLYYRYRSLLLICFWHIFYNLLVVIIGNLLQTHLFSDYQLRAVLILTIVLSLTLLFVFLTKYYFQNEERKKKG